MTISESCLENESISRKGREDFWLSGVDTDKRRNSPKRQREICRQKYSG